MCATSECSGRWLSSFWEKNEIYKSFEASIHILQVDPMTTYVTIGYDDCVKGVMLVLA